MRRINPLQLLLTICLSVSIVALAVAPKAVAAETNSNHKLPFWSAKGASNTVYFLGSVHVLKKSHYPLPAPIEDAYRKAGIVVFETEISRMEEPAVLSKILQEASYPQGQTIKKDLPPETYELLRKTSAKKLGSPAVLDGIKPYMAALTLVALEFQRLGFNSKDGVDQYFHTKAKADKKRIQQFETVEEQFSFFSGLTKDQQTEFLESSLKEIDQLEKMMDDMIAAWKNGDSKLLNDLILDSMNDYPDLIKRFLTDRNRNWVKQTEALLNERDDVFVVVGAAHLVGKDNLLELLQGKGFKIEQATLKSQIK